MATGQRIAVIPGDGIGIETVEQALRVLDAVVSLHDLDLTRVSFPWGCDHYLRTGRMMDGDAIERLAGFDAILLGAVGRPDVPDHVSVWELIMPIRRQFQQYVNLRPIRLFEGVRGPLRDVSEGLDFVVVRENNEGEYLDVGGLLQPGSPAESCVQLASFSRVGTERIAEYAFDLAERRGRRLISATKSNGLPHSMPYWDAVVAAVAERHPKVETRSIHIDALAAFFVLRPMELDVVVASNLFGDILSDLGAAIAGSIGIAPSANINPERRHPSMFEPIHGSAPDIAGRGIANPIGQIWSLAMLLAHLGHPAAAAMTETAIADVLRAGDVLTPDLGGTAGCADVGDAVVAALNGS